MLKGEISKRAIELTSLSVVDDYKQAKKEWGFKGAYEIPEHKDCICNEKITRHAILIENRRNKATKEICKTCLSIILGMKSFGKIFRCYNKIKKDYTLGRMELNTIDLLHEYNVLNNFERTFYRGLRSGTISYAQQQVLEKINKQFLNFMNPNPNGFDLIIKRIDKWHQNNPSVDISFLKPIKIFLRNNYTITPVQKKRLDKFILLNRIP